jgi:hypothetical protein
VYLVQNDFAHQGGVVRPGIHAERRQHSCDQAFVTRYSHQRQSPMPQKPTAEGGERCRHFGHRGRNRFDSTLLPQILNEALNSRRIVSGNVFLAASTRTLAMVFSERFDGLFVDISKV